MNWIFRSHPKVFLSWVNRRIFDQVTSKGISIVGERKIPEEGKNVKYHRREREAGKFSRLINLSGDIDVNKVDADLKNGILTVTIRKAEAAKPRQITVN
jgi:HSP20 family protein